MIFSGHVTSYRCDGCAAEYAHVTPTSLLPIGAVVTLASVPWGHTLARVIAYRGLNANEPAPPRGEPAHTAHAGVEHAEDTLDP